MSTTRITAVAVIVSLLLASGALADWDHGGMLDPSMDTPGEPFSYFWHPTDVIGGLYAPVASEVTPEGYVYTGFGELMFFTGNPPEPVNVRIKTLQQGCLPIVQYHLVRNGVRYRFTLFAADLGGPLAGLPVNFARVELVNESDQARAAFLSSAFRFAPLATTVYGLPDYRFTQRFDLIPKELTKGQTAHNPAWVYSFTKNALLRDGRVLYVFPTDPKPQLAALLRNGSGVHALRYFSGVVEEYARSRVPHGPQTPVGLVMYRVPLGPGERRELVFKMPLAPLPKDSEEAKLVEAADCAAQLRRTASLWNDLVVKPSPLVFPEAKVQEYLLANTIYTLLAIDKIADDYVINVNKFQYHRCYPGNGADMLVALDYMGLAEPARKCLLYLHKTQFPDGSLGVPHVKLEQQQWWEMNGYVLWAWHRHYQLTADRDFLAAVYPGVMAAVKWINAKTQQDPQGLMPPVKIADDAMLAGVHQTGQSMWIMIGLLNAEGMAKAMGKPDDAAAIRAQYQRYRAAFDKLLAVQTAASGNVIPPSLEQTRAGNDWDNLLLLYPEPLFEPFDPRVTASIRHTRRQYLEGILRYVTPMALAKRGTPDWPDVAMAGLGTIAAGNYLFNNRPVLHYWQTPNLAQAALVRGSAEDQQDAVADLYALLLHTSSSHAPQEFGTSPWGTRDLGVGHNLLPDGAASGKTIELIRNMLVREQEKDLVLFSAVSPDWLRPGKALEARRAPTYFGPLSFVLRADQDGLNLRLDPQFRQAPARIVVRVPWFFELQSAQADGRAVQPAKGQLALAPTTRELTLRGRIKPETPELSFEKAVERYKQEYRRRYEEFLRTGIRLP